MLTPFLPLLATLADLAAGAGGDAPAPVSKVVVYEDGVRITRSVPVDLKATRRIEPLFLPREIDPASVRVTVAEGAGVVLDSIEVTRLGAEALPVAETRRLVAAFAELNDEVERAELELNAVERALATLGQEPDTDVKLDPAWTGPDPARWREIFGTFRALTDRLGQRQAKRTAELDALEARRAALRRAAAQAADGEGRVRLVISARGTGRAVLAVSYLLAGPRWRPRYELRLDPARDELSVALQAAVEQSTGEDWTDVGLTVRTALGETSLALPRLPRWTVGERQRFIPTTVTEAPRTDTKTPPAPRDSEAKRLAERLRELANESAPEPAPKPPARPRNAVAITEAYDVEASAALPASATCVISGFVFDSTGLPLVGVKLLLHGPETRTVFSGEEGAFRFDALPQGIYEMTARYPRVPEVRQTGIIVRAGQTSEVNLVMENQGGGNEAVMIRESAPLVSTAAAAGSSSWNLTPVAPRDERPQVEAAFAVPAPIAPRLDLSFSAPRPTTIRSGAGEVVSLFEARWPVQVVRRLFPAVHPEALVVATLRSPLPTALPAGEARIFFADEPVGRTPIDIVRTGEPLTLAVGSDRAVQSKRRVALLTSEAGLPFRKRVVNRYTVSIEVSNPRPRRVALEIFDQVPRCRDDSITVRLDESPPEAKLDEATGVLSWRTELAAGTRGRFQFVYSIEHPKGQRLAQ
jgi:hypothetical protein